MLCECGCGQPTRIATHTDRWAGQTKGKPLRFIHGHVRGRQYPPAIERFFARIEEDPETHCWIWQGSRLKNGYGQFSWDRKVGLIHRFAYQTFVGPIPTDLELDHLCRNRACGNPGHLEPVTRRENCLRGETGKYPRQQAIEQEPER